MGRIFFTFPKMLIRRIYSTIWSFFSFDFILCSCDLNVRFRADIVGRNWMLDTLKGFKGSFSLFRLQISHVVLKAVVPKKKKQV